MINFLCRHYKASRPCAFNKADGSECPSCAHVSNFKERVLFVKLDAIGDVLRSASLLPDIVAKHEAPYIAWLTRKELLELVGMMKYVDEVIELSEIGIARVKTGSWDYVYSLSNDMASASIASCAPAKNLPIGYFVREGTIEPSNSAARHWLEMAAFDRLKRENTRSYQDLMRAILGLDDTAVARPALEVASHLRVSAAARVSALFPGSARRRVAVNVGAGGRWPKKMLTSMQIHQYIDRLLASANVDVMLVGGGAEVEKAKEILTICGNNERIRPALTAISIPEFVAVLSEADALLCGDTLALHIASALDLPTVAVFGPTSIAEIPDFNGLIIRVAAPALDCLGCYGDCAKRDNCMSLLDLDYLVHSTIAQLSRRQAA